MPSCAGGEDVSNENLMVMIDGREFPVLRASESVADDDSGAIHSMEVGWEAPYVLRANTVALKSGGEQRGIRVLAARFRDGNQKVAFLYQ
ncbi:MAG TPA: hypothetical protein VNT60_11395 [Deinococcales bacterium]|nr:hypothetical protein [Deinococcales bacterium]